jgi:hypothetical protein
MNLERDTAPTGFYNNLPRFRKTRSVIGPLKKGLLKKVGYDVTKSRTRRRSAVSRAVKKYGRSSTIKKLNAVAVLTRRTSPAKSKKFKADMRAAQKMKGGVHELQAILSELSYVMSDAEGASDMPTPKSILDKLKGKIEFPSDLSVGSVYSAVKNKITDDARKK